MTILCRNHSSPVKGLARGIGQGWWWKERGPPKGPSLEPNHVMTD
jgi:hypothetical protein